MSYNKYLVMIAVDWIIIVINLINIFMRKTYSKHDIMNMYLKCLEKTDGEGVAFDITIFRAKVAAGTDYFGMSLEDKQDMIDLLVGTNLTTCSSYTMHEATVEILRLIDSMQKVQNGLTGEEVVEVLVNVVDDLKKGEPILSDTCEGCSKVSLEDTCEIPAENTCETSIPNLEDTCEIPTKNFWEISAEDICEIPAEDICETDSPNLEEGNGTDSSNSENICEIDPSNSEPICEIDPSNSEPICEIDPSNSEPICKTCSLKPEDMLEFSLEEVQEALAILIEDVKNGNLIIHWDKMEGTDPSTWNINEIFESVEPICEVPTENTCKTCIPNPENTCETCIPNPENICETCIPNPENIYRSKPYFQGTANYFQNISSETIWNLFYEGWHIFAKIITFDAEIYIYFSNIATDILSSWFFYLVLVGPMGGNLGIKYYMTLIYHPLSSWIFWMFFFELSFLSILAILCYVRIFEIGTMTEMKIYKKMLIISIIGLGILIYELLFCINYINILMGEDNSHSIFIYSIDSLMGKENIYAYNQTIIYGPTLILIRLIICIVSILFLISMFNVAKYERHLNCDLIILILLNIFALWWIAAVNNYMIMFILIELQSLSLYVIIALNYDKSNLSIESGIKYFLYGSFASGILLFGISLIYGSLGSCSFSHIYELLVHSSMEQIPFTYILGLIFVLAGLFFKLGIAPFHFWVADVYRGTSLLIVYFLTTLTKIPLIFLVYRAVGIFVNPLIQNQFLNFQDLIWMEWGCNLGILCGLVSICIGAYGAFNTENLHRFFAFSGISNMGFIIVSLFSGTFEGLVAAIYYLSIYIFTMIVIFTLLLFLRKNNNYDFLTNVTELSTVIHGSPGIAIGLACAFFSLAGIPPFGGFFGKVMIIIAYLKASNYLIALYLLIFSVWIPIYYIRMIRWEFFFNYGKEFKKKFISLTLLEKFIIVFLVIFLVLIFFFQIKMWSFATLMAFLIQQFF